MKNIQCFKSFLIVEKSINDVTLNDINLKKFIQLQDEKDFLNPYVGQYVAEEEYRFLDWEIDKDEAENIKDSKEFKNWLYYELEYRFNDLKDMFNSLIITNEIILYRAMTVKNNYIDLLLNDKIKHIGIYWSFDEDCAETHWGYNLKITDTIVYTIKIQQKYVNWVDTLRLNLEHEYFNEEKEVRLFRNTPIEIINILWNNKNINKNSIKHLRSYNIVT